MIAAACCLATLAACTPASPTTPVPPTPSGPGLVTPSPSATVDLTAPGEARAAVARLVDAAGTDRVLMVVITSADASVTVLRAGRAETWALRGGEPRQVESDTTYVSQAAFDVTSFDLADVGALFRAAAAVSGSDSRQVLQIVDYSAGLVMMTVSTNPESRTVFFRADGSLLPTLDFDAAWGLAEGLSDAVGSATSVHAIGLGSQLGAYVEVPGQTPGTIVRRQRTARVPVVVSSRSEASPPPPFDAGVLDTDAVWQVLDGLRRRSAWSPGQEWSCVVDDRSGLGEPRLHFQVGPESFTTDLAGRRVEA